MVARGLSTKLVDRALGLSTNAVDAHRYQISQRLQVHDAAGMVRYAIRHGLAENTEWGRHPTGGCRPGLAS